MGEIPNPGSDAALDLGCCCPVLDNGHGRGGWLDPAGKPVFWICESCPLHKSPSPAADVDGAE